VGWAVQWAKAQFQLIENKKALSNISNKNKCLKTFGII
jgi:hypothetical protein